MSSYCGKNCDTCTYREELSCTAAPRRFVQKRSELPGK